MGIEDEIFQFKKKVDNAKVDKANLEGRMQGIKEKLSEMEINGIDDGKKKLEEWKEILEDHKRKLQEGYEKLKKEIK